MSELQNDSVESEVIEPTVNENPDNGAELAVDSEAKHEEKTQVELDAEKQAKFDEAYGVQYGKTKQAERNAEALQQRVDDFEKSERERQAAAVGDIPPIPDALDDDFEQKMAVRDQAIKDQANHNATNNAWIKQQEANQQQVQLAQQQEQAKVLQGHNERVKAQGIDANEMLAAENTVLQYGIHPDSIRHIAGQEDSPNVIRYLAANPQEGYSLATGNSFEIAAKYAEIRVKAEALKPKTSDTPAPADTLSGNGVDPDAKKHPALQGVKYS